MSGHITLKVGSRYYAIETEVLPPIGTRIQVHKHLTEDGSAVTVEVTGHEWRLEEGAGDGESPFFGLAIESKIVD